MRTLLLSLLVAALAVAFVAEVAPAFMRAWNLHAATVDEAERYARHHMQSVARDCPKLGGRLAAEVKDTLADGAFWPALAHAWASASVVQTVGGMTRWASRNFLVRILSPTSTWEYVALVAFMSTVLLVTAAVLWVCANLRSSALMVDAIRGKAEVASSSTNRNSVSWQ